MRGKQTWVNCQPIDWWHRRSCFCLFKCPNACYNHQGSLGQCNLSRWRWVAGPSCLILSSGNIYLFGADVCTGVYLKSRATAEGTQWYRKIWVLLKAYNVMVSSVCELWFLASHCGEKQKKLKNASGVFTIKENLMLEHLSCWDFILSMLSTYSINVFQLVHIDKCNQSKLGHLSDSSQLLDLRSCKQAESFQWWCTNQFLPPNLAKDHFHST